MSILVFLYLFVSSTYFPAYLSFPTNRFRYGSIQRNVINISDNLEYLKPSYGNPNILFYNEVASNAAIVTIASQVIGYSLGIKSKSFFDEISLVETFCHNDLLQLYLMSITLGMYNDFHSLANTYNESNMNGVDLNNIGHPSLSRFPFPSQRNDYVPMLAILVHSNTNQGDYISSLSRSNLGKWIYEI